MKKRITAILAAMMMLATAVAFTGCGESEPKTLEEYLANDEAARQEVEEAVKEQSGDEMTVDVAYEGNNVIITSTLKETYDENTLDAVKKAFEGMGDDLDRNIKESISQIEESTGITGVTMDVIIKNGDGKEIWKNHFANE